MKGPSERLKTKMVERRHWKKSEILLRSDLPSPIRISLSNKISTAGAM